MTNKTKVALAAVSLATAFAFGRFSVPESVKIVEVEKKVTTDKSQTEKERTKKIVKKKVTKPDGTTIETSRETDVSKDSEKVDKSKTEDKSKSSETAKSSGTLTIEAMAGVRIPGQDIEYGAHISRNLIGPVRLGIWGLTSGTVGVSLGLSF